MACATIVISDNNHGGGRKRGKGRGVLDVGEVWGLVGDRLEIIDGDVDVRRASHSENVENGVSGTTDDVDDGNSVQERVASENVPIQR